MKNSFLICFSFLIFSFSFSQTQNSGNVSISWLEKKNINIGNNKTSITCFEGNDCFYDSDKREIWFSKFLGTNLELGSNISISNVVFEQISSSQLGDLNIKSIPNSVGETLKQNKSRNIIESFLSLSPIIKDDVGNYKRIKSFSYHILSTVTNKNYLDSYKTGIYNSVLKSGEWYRFYITKSGVYKISKAFLKQLGIDVNVINPQKLKIFGNGGRMLPLSNNIEYPLDLTENAIQIVGENDGIFNDEDYILFYAEGVDNWNEESKTHLNLYDTKSYYYITVTGDNGKRILPMQHPTGEISLSLDSFDDYQYHEIDIVNIAHKGRQWVGETFDSSISKEFAFIFPNIDTSSPVKITISLASSSYTNTAFSVFANNAVVGNISFPALIANSGFEYNTQVSPELTFVGAENMRIKLVYNNNGVPGSKGYLDYIALSAKRKLRGYDKQFSFQYNSATTSLGIVEYKFSNASKISQIFDITDIYNVSNVVNASKDSFSFTANLGETRKYIALDDSDFYMPLHDNITKIPNQNIKGTIFLNSNAAFQDVDYVIISPQYLSQQAEKLADFHRIHSNYNVKVISLESIYQEFSSGKQDIAAIRNCLKYIYDNASSQDKKIRFVNLFGDASYDYLNRIKNNTNIVPTYHSLISNSSEEGTFLSDDFYGLMDDTEGNIVSDFGGIDIAVGRMLVDNINRAEQMANKILQYHDIKSTGSWRNNILFIADDSDNSSDSTLQSKQNSLAETIFADKPFFNVEKLFLDAYKQEVVSGGERYPKARKELYNKIEKGALVLNYLGHGGKDGLTTEKLWTTTDGQNLSNSYKYPLFITITCDFSGFDDPASVSAGEYTYWNAKGGTISMITTTRTIAQVNAEVFNETLMNTIFTNTNQRYKSIAESLRMAKNTNPNSSTNVVLFIGDPAINLAIPKPKINLTMVNGMPITETYDDLKSLSKIKLSGEVTDENNVLLSDFNGELAAIVFDKFITKSTLNNDGFSPSMSFNTFGEAFFRGNATVKNGLFEFNFIVPKDIRIPLGKGRISFYTKKNQPIEDYSGYNNTINVGGMNENAAEDNIAPQLKLYLNDESFVSGGISSESPLLLANLKDESGINTAGGIGHDILAVLDGDEANSYVLNDFYETELDDFTQGTIKFQLKKLSVGTHSLKLTVWDTYNNPTSQEIKFTVAADDKLTISNVLNYPNPFVSYTEFWFTHNKPYETLDVQVQIFTITGKIVCTKNQSIYSTSFSSRDIKWDGRDNYGNRIGKGVYVYRLTVKSRLTNSTAEKIEKLVIL